MAPVVMTYARMGVSCGGGRSAEGPSSSEMGATIVARRKDQWCRPLPAVITSGDRFAPCKKVAISDSESRDAQGVTVRVEISLCNAAR